MASIFRRRGLAGFWASLGMLFPLCTISAAAQQDPTQYPQQDPSQYPQQDTAQASQQGPSQTAWDVARVSFVQGKVQLAAGSQTPFSDAVVNMPLVEGSRLQTGDDGQAEVEFGDGSVARLTPNSSLQIDHIAQDQVQMQQLSGLGYYELNVGDGHPSFVVEFPAGAVTPSANAIFRLDLDNVPEIAVITGGAQVSGNGFQAATVGENQSFRMDASNGAPYTVAQGITQDSWDQWNSDRDQAISQEAAEQTPVRDDSGASGSENWNDLDAYGNWYPVAGTGNVWVPGGVDTDWDPFGYGYWGFYPGIGYTWISGYPWGWLPYHCGTWTFFSFGWGWAPGGCGAHWLPVVGVHGYPGYFIPARPVWHPGHPFPAPHLLIVNRGPRSTGIWGPGHPVAPSMNHEAALTINGREVSPVNRTAFASNAYSGARGTSPGTRAALSGNPVRVPQSRAALPTQPPRTNSRSTYAPAPRPTETPHYSPPPRYSAPPAQHYSPPPPPHGGGRGRR